MSLFSFFTSSSPSHCTPSPSLSTSLSSGYSLAKYIVTQALFLDNPMDSWTHELVFVFWSALSRLL